MELEENLSGLNYLVFSSVLDNCDFSVISIMILICRQTDTLSP